ncbi:MAG: TIGR00725 family protein [bacterium]|nr:TIGR00725 family protein [bacterium]
MFESPATPIAVIGAAAATAEVAALAAEVGREIAGRGGVVICGGRGGVMEHSARGATEAGGVAIGILPGRRGEEVPNDYLEHRIFTGIGQARNQVIVLSAVAVIAVSGGWGTLSEIALALKHRVPVVLLSGLEVRPPDGREEALLFRAQTPAEAVAIAFDNARRPS